MSLAALNEALRGALKDPELIKRQEALGITVLAMYQIMACMPTPRFTTGRSAPGRGVTACSASRARSATRSVGDSRPRRPRSAASAAASIGS